MKASNVILLAMFLCFVAYSCWRMSGLKEFSAQSHNGIKETSVQRSSTKFTEYSKLGEVQEVFVQGLSLEVMQGEQDMLIIEGDSAGVRGVKFTYNESAKVLTIYCPEVGLGQKPESPMIQLVMRESKGLRTLQAKGAAIRVKDILEAKKLSIDLDQKSSLNSAIQAEELHMSVKDGSRALLEIDCDTIWVEGGRSELLLTGEAKKADFRIRAGARLTADDFRSPKLWVDVIDAHASVYVSEKAELKAGEGASIFYKGNNEGAKLRNNGGELIFH